MKLIWWIIVGYFNMLRAQLNMLNKEKRDLYNKRYSICKKCKHLNKFEMCKICGCYVKAKTKVTNAYCPKKFW